MIQPNYLANEGDRRVLLAALDAGQLRHAVLDVFAVEPATDSPLFGTRGLICTPHLGAATTEAQENVALQVAEQMSDYLLSGAISNAWRSKAFCTCSKPIRS
mgnify:CR=1 FL=1